MTKRKMATIRSISEIKSHLNADNLEIAIVDGWQCVVKKGQFKSSQPIIYFEIDSWIPTEVAPFLTKASKEPKEYLGIKGERLRTAKLRGELSQGLILPIGTIHGSPPLDIGENVSYILNIEKWERPINHNLAGFAKGNFPEFIRKTDQERIQNIFHKLTQDQIEDTYEVTLKMDGSSCTFYHNNGVTGVCSRNLELKTDESNADNSFVRMFNSLELDGKLKDLGLNIAIQGELWGVGINGNWEKANCHHYDVFDIFDIDNQKYLDDVSRKNICDTLNIFHVQVEDFHKLTQFESVDSFLKYAERPSLVNKVAEGVVFKSLKNPEFSFKVVSSSYLLSGGE